MAEIICTECPLGCQVTLTVGADDIIVAMSGANCKIGEKYASQEYRVPNRVLTTTVLVEGGGQALLPVRSSRPIPKQVLVRCAQSLASVRAKAPVNCGDVIVRNLLDTGADLVATGKVE